MADPLNAKPMEQKNYLLYIIAGALVVLIIMAVIGVVVGTALIVNFQRNLKPVATTKVEPTPTLTPLPGKKYASDSAVVKLRDELIKLRTEIDTMDYFEAQIVPPSLDSKIRIE